VVAEKNATETQMASWNPGRILDETDSGLDIDALRVAAGGVNQFTTRKTQ